MSLSRAAIILVEMGCAGGRELASEACYWDLLLAERRPFCEEGDFRMGDGVLRGDMDFLRDFGVLMGFSCACIYYKCRCSNDKTYLDGGKRKEDKG